MFECQACEVRWRDNTTICWCCGERIGEKVTADVAVQQFGAGVAAAYAAAMAARQA